MTILLGLAVLLIAVIAGLLLLRGRSPEESGDGAPPLGLATSPLPARASPAGAGPEVVPEPAKFDADATSVYLRPPQADSQAKIRDSGLPEFLALRLAYGQ